MKKVIDENQAFFRKEVPGRAEAAGDHQEIGQERYKIGRLADIPEGEAISFYRTASSRSVRPAPTSTTRNNNQPSAALDRRRLSPRR